MEGNYKVTFRLHGRFRVIGPSGENLTPSSAKSQGLLALLLDSDVYERSRTWLQDKLWSDRAREQGSASLRQSLVEIRKAFGEFRNIISANRLAVSLSEGTFLIETDRQSGEFLEGLDVKDPEFEDWLRLERSRRGAPLEAPSLCTESGLLPAVVLDTVGTEDRSLENVEFFFVDCVARTLREALNINVYTRNPPRRCERMLHVRIQATKPCVDQAGINVRIMDGDTSQILWSGVQNVRVHGAFPYEDLDFLKLGNQLVSAVAEHLRLRCTGNPDAQDATLLGLLAIHKLFSMNETSVADADQALLNAYERDPRAVFLAWRAQLKGIQFVERHSSDGNALKSEGLALSTVALQADPTNSIVLATAANARLILDEDFFGCDELSKKSVELNPSNPLGWWSRSAAKLYTDRKEEAYRFALRAYRLASGSPYSFWWDLQCALAAAATGKSDEAILMAERCSALAPEFRPPLRYMIALYAAKGADKRARKKVAKLKQLETGFSVEEMANNSSYPVSLMRRYDILNRDRVLALR